MAWLQRLGVSVRNLPMGPSPLQIVIVLGIVILLFVAGRLVDRAATEHGRLMGARRRRKGASALTSAAGPDKSQKDNASRDQG